MHSRPAPRFYFLAALLLCCFLSLTKTTPAAALSSFGFPTITYAPNNSSIPTYATFSTGNGSTITLHPVGTNLNGSGQAIIDTQTIDGKTYYAYGNCSGFSCSADRVYYEPISGDYKVMAGDALPNSLVSVQGGDGSIPLALANNGDLSNLTINPVDPMAFPYSDPYLNPDLSGNDFSPAIDTSLAIDQNSPFPAGQLPDLANGASSGITPSVSGMPAGEIINVDNPLPVTGVSAPMSGIDVSLDLGPNGKPISYMNGTLTDYVPLQTDPVTGRVTGGYDLGSGGASVSQTDPFSTGGVSSCSTCQGGLSSGLAGDQGGGILGSGGGGGSSGPFGGAITIILPCVDGSKWMTITGPTAGNYIWSLSTKTYLSGPPSHPGQWVLGLAGGNKICTTAGGAHLPGKEMSMVGTSP